MAQSILSSIKKLVGIADSDDAFDLDIMLHINSTFSVLKQLGIGPVEGFMIEDATTTWDAFIGDSLPLNMVKTYIYLKVKLVFDPPQTSFVIESINRNIQDLEWRLNVEREGASWTDPSISL